MLGFYAPNPNLLTNSPTFRLKARIACRPKQATDAAHLRSLGTSLSASAGKRGPSEIRKGPASRSRKTAVFELAICHPEGTQIGFGRNGREDFQQKQVAEQARDRRAAARSASLLLLRHGADSGSDPPAFCRRGHLLERGGSLQHRLDAPGPGREEGRGG